MAAFGHRIIGHLVWNRSWGCPRSFGPPTQIQTMYGLEETRFLLSDCGLVRRP